MITLKAVVRKPRTDGFFSVYIRIVHNRKPGYIKTNKIIDAAHIDSNGELTDPVVNEYCSMIIRQYTDRLNRTDISLWDVKDVLEYLQKTDEEVCFSEYAKSFIHKMEMEGRHRTAKNYKLAVAHLERYLGTNRLMFSLLTSTVLKKWIESLSQTSRAKEMYPTNIRQIFKAAIADLNDEERGVNRIKFNPWLKISIPKSDNAVQKAISAEACREFFNRPLPKTKMISSLTELGRDVALLSLCIGGINSVDLYELKKKDYKNGVIGYQRAKTRNSRRDNAYMEMRIEPFIQSTFEKYLSDDKDEPYLFNFHQPLFSKLEAHARGVEYWWRKINTEMLKYPYETSNLAGTVSVTYNGTREIFDRNMFEEYVDLEFEGAAFKAFRRWDEWLSQEFGDYMTLPPENERKTHDLTVYLLDD